MPPSANCLTWKFRAWQIAIWCDIACGYEPHMRTRDSQRLSPSTTTTKQLPDPSGLTSVASRAGIVLRRIFPQNIKPEQYAHGQIRLYRIYPGVFFEDRTCCAGASPLSQTPSE